MHELRESPKAAEEATLALVYACQQGRLPERGADRRAIISPDKKNLFAQNRIERDRLRAAAPLRENEQTFWKDYLHKYTILESVGDYQEYLSLIGDCLGRVEPGMVYFDCGSGNGMYGAWCVRDILLRGKVGDGVPPVYFGLDLTQKGLSDASVKHAKAGVTLREDGALLDLMYFRFDLDDLDPDLSAGLRLPFADGSVDRICCSLLISYLKRPQFLLQELFRILKDDGRIVVSSMKPYCDLSVIYKDVVEEAKGEQTLQSARDLLSAAGAIKLKEEEGHYKFYEGEEIVECLAAAGFSEMETHRSFGNQANLVCAGK